MAPPDDARRGLRARLKRLARLGDEAGPAPYPLDRTNDRHLPPDWCGDVFVWDIDKTYLQTEFGSLKGLVSTALEAAVDKHQVAGTDVLLHALRRGPSSAGTRPYRGNPLYFVSGSPAPLRTVIQRKMLIDGVEYDGITFKDWVGLIRRGKMADIAHQVGYKMAALLRNRVELPMHDGVSEHLFGDDSESDALIYSMYADTVAGRLRGEALVATLMLNGVDAEDAAYVRSLADGLPHVELVRGIYIHLAKASPLSRFDGFGSRVVPCDGAFQMALCLWQQRRVDASDVVAVGREVRHAASLEPTVLLARAVSLVERGVLALSALEEVWEALQRGGVVPYYVRVTDVDVEAGAEEPAAPETPAAAAGFVTPAARLALGAQATAPTA